MFALFLVFLMIGSSWLFMQRHWWLPELASLHGAGVDRVFLITLIISGVLFILLQGALAYITFRFGSKRGGRVRHWIGPRLEKRFALIAGIIIFGVDVTLYALGDSQWVSFWGTPPPGTPIIEVMGEQFAWNFRYAGPDGVFGRTDPVLISSTNPFGLDKTDPAAKDDILSINQLHLPEDLPIRLRIRSHDVIHSFYLPYQRIKQDAVPGMQIELWFVPQKTGQFEIASMRRSYWHRRSSYSSSTLFGASSAGSEQLKIHGKRIRWSGLYPADSTRKLDRTNSRGVPLAI